MKYMLTIANHTKYVSKTSWFPNKGYSWVYKKWDASKMGGRSGLF